MKAIIEIPDDLLDAIHAATGVSIQGALRLRYADHSGRSAIRAAIPEGYDDADHSVYTECEIEPIDSLFVWPISLAGPVPFGTLKPLARFYMLDRDGQPIEGTLSTKGNQSGTSFAVAAETHTAYLLHYWTLVAPAEGGN